MLDLHLGNCIDVISTLADHSVDAVVTDPPYGETNLSWDVWQGDFIPAVDRVLKPTGSMWVFGTFRMFTENWSDFDGWSLAQDIIWEKHNGSGFANDRFRRVHEHAVQFYRGAWGDVYKGKVVTMDAKKRSLKRSSSPAHIAGCRGEVEYSTEDGGPRLQRSVIYARSQHGSALHPTQKPEAIVEPLIVNSCPPGGTVLDPFAGSGSTGFVANRIGRAAILIEANPEYHAVIQGRFGSDLFGSHSLGGVA